MLAAEIVDGGKTLDDGAEDEKLPLCCRPRV